MKRERSIGKFVVSETEAEWKFSHKKLSLEIHAWSITRLSHSKLHDRRLAIVNEITYILHHHSG